MVVGILFGARCVRPIDLAVDLVINCVAGIEHVDDRSVLFTVFTPVTSKDSSKTLNALAH